ncbi:MAG: hypothetical protein FJX76_01650 [Armatimonadetes bacterium]|nr:hypothetical protein [Armatimonadota bacterium]
MKMRTEFVEALPPAFLDYYRKHFQGDRKIYGHWSGGLYSRPVGNFHKQIAVARPTELDEAIQKYTEARERRVGGAIPGLFHNIDEHRKKAVLQTFTNAPYDQDLAEHTRGRESNAIALGIMCGYRARPNDLGHAFPLPLQLRGLAALIAEAALAVRAPVENFLTASEAADNLDYPAMDDPAAPHPPYGFRTTRESWALEAWIEPPALAVHAPLQSARPGWYRLGDWLRETALADVMKRTHGEWASEPEK